MHNYGNPQEKTTLEQDHQVTENVVCRFDFKKNRYKEDPWAGILAASSFAILSMDHTVLQVKTGPHL